MTKNKILTTFLTIIIGLSGFLLQSCKDDIQQTVSSDENLNSGPYTLTIPIAVPDVQYVTRAAFETQIKIGDVWVGVYDRESGKIIGSSITSINEESFSTAHTQDGTETVKIENLIFDDSNPYVYIAGVANFNGIMGYNSDGEYKALSEILEEANTWQKYINIGVDAVSAEANFDNNGPLLSGLFSQGTVTSSHGNNTIDYNGVAGNDKGGSNLPYAKLFDTNYGYETAKDEIRITGGVVHLRRLFSHINVNLIPGEGINITEPTWEVYNIPNAVYLQERTSVTNVESYKGNEWLNVTPAYSDILGDKGYSSSLDNVTAYQTDGDPVEDNEIEVDKIKYKGWTFGFWHYENKHWGTSNTTSYSQRELKYEGTDYYKSLVPDVSDHPNNNATYFVIKGHVKDASGREGDIEYLIHEGYACDELGVASSAENIRSRDFSTFRNTNYTYNIFINGLNSIIVKVDKENDNYNPEYNPGATGTVWGSVTEKAVSKKGDSFDVSLPEGKVFWWIQEKSADDDGIKVNFGSSVEEDSPYYSRYLELYGNQQGSKEESSFYNGIKLDGQSLDEFVSNGGTHTLTLPVVSNGIYMLYLGVEMRSDDGMSIYQPVMQYTLDASKLDQPTIIHKGELSMPSALIVGLASNKIFWKAVDGADSYEISIGGKTYTITASNFTSEECEFAIPYSNLNNLTGQQIITVTAKTDAGMSSSDSYIVTMTQPIWDFSSSEWASVISDLVGDGLTEYDKTINGLNVYAGEKLIKSGSDYIQMNNSGSPTQDVFRFKAYSKGKLKVTICHSSKNGTTGRTLNIQTIDVESISLDPYYSGNKGTIEVTIPELSVEDEFNIFIYGKGGATNFYKIEFTPED